VAWTGREGSIELAKLESLYAAMRQTPTRLRRTLAGALITLDSDWIVVERAPPRRSSARSGGAGGRSAMPKHRKRTFTKRLIKGLRWAVSVGGPGGAPYIA